MWTEVAIPEGAERSEGGVLGHEVGDTTRRRILFSCGNRFSYIRSRGPTGGIHRGISGTSEAGTPSYNNVVKCIQTPTHNNTLYPFSTLGLFIYTHN